MEQLEATSRSANNELELRGGLDFATLTDEIKSSS